MPASTGRIRRAANAKTLPPRLFVIAGRTATAIAITAANTTSAPTNVADVILFGCERTDRRDQRLDLVRRQLLAVGRHLSLAVRRDLLQFAVGHLLHFGGA